MPLNILFVGANGLDMPRLELGAELGGVMAEIERAQKRKAINVKAISQPRPWDLQRALLDEKPDVLHFSTHGLRFQLDESLATTDTREFGKAKKPPPVDAKTNGAILLVDENGASSPVPPNALDAVLKILGKQRCVVLNACFSLDQAEMIAEHVDCVIGMDGPIDDASAVVFSLGFYQAAARHRNVQDAFDLAKNLIRLCNLPDANRPTLRCRKNVDPRMIYLLPRRRPWLYVASVVGALSMLALCARGESAADVATSAPSASTSSSGKAVEASYDHVEIPTNEPASGTIVVVGPNENPSGGRPSTESLCKQLERVRIAPEKRPLCLYRGKLDTDTVLLSEAAKANVSVLVAVDKMGLAQVFNLGKLATHDWYAKNLPAVDLTEPSVIEALAPLIYEWARVADLGGGAKMTFSRLRCGESVEKDAYGIALMTLFLRGFDTNCGSAPGDVESVRQRCRENCKIVESLEAGSKNGELMTIAACDAKKDHREQFVCKLENALRSCYAGDKQDTQTRLADLEIVENPIYEMALSDVSACMLTRMQDHSEEERKLLETRAAWIVPKCKYENCRNGSPGMCTLCGSMLAQRASHWVHARNWRQAEEDYTQAFRLEPNNEILFNIIASRLHRFNEVNGKVLVRETAKDLKKLAHVEKKHWVRAALIEWIAAKRADNKTFEDEAERKFVAKYSELDDGKAVYAKDVPDEIEKSLICPREAKICPVYDLLSVGKAAENAARLRNALQQTVLPRE